MKLTGTTPYLGKLNIQMTPKQRLKLIAAQRKGMVGKTYCKYLDKQGKIRVKGSKLLKQTQSYPPIFGNAVALARYEYERQSGSSSFDVKDHDLIPEQTDSSNVEGDWDDHDCMDDVVC